MNILHVTSGYPPIYKSGGASRSAQELAESQVDRGHTVTVFTTDLAEPNTESIPQKENINGVRVFRFNNVSKSLAYNSKIPISPSMGVQIHKNKNYFDISHCHEFRTIQAASLHMFSSETLPYILQPRGEVPRKSKSRMKLAFDAILGSRILRSADAIIASSRIESSQFIPTFDASEIPSKFYVPNGIDTTKYCPTEPDDAFFEKYELSDSDTHILFLSRISERKGVDNLVRSFKKIRNQDNSTRLILAGPDEGALPAIQSLIRELRLENAVNIVGPVYGKEKLQLYSFADFFVLPSKNEYESFGRVALEALACGTPVLVTDVCGVSEWIESKQMLKAEPNVQSISKKLQLALFEQEIHKEKFDITQTLHGLSWDDVAVATEDVYQSVLSTNF